MPKILMSLMKKLSVLSYFSQVLKRRKRFEYKLQKQNKEKADFLAYIQYEMGILSLIELRREVSHASNTAELNACIREHISFCCREEN